MGAVPLNDLTNYLDDYLQLSEFDDFPGAMNGLQVENSGTVTALVAAVDASQKTFDRVVAESSRGTMVLVHHGLFWDGNRAITGRRYRRVRALLEHDIALYSAHLPLDSHPEVGNNALLAQLLGISNPEPFDQHKGKPFGAAGNLAISREALVKKLAKELNAEQVHLISGGPEMTTKVGVITGGAGGSIERAAEQGIDTFITGEGAHHTTFDAEEFGVNVIYAGHYATETLGVKAIAAKLGKLFDLDWQFHDHPTGL